MPPSSDLISRSDQPRTLRGAAAAIYLQGIAEGAMALTFPTYFPKAFLGPVAKAEANAEREFRADVKAIEHGDSAATKRAATKYITAVAFAFAHQACAAARGEDPPVGGSRVAWYVEDFLRRLSAHLYHELAAPDLRHSWGSWQGFERGMWSVVTESQGWADHLAERAAIADDGSDVSSIKTAVYQVPSAVGAITENDGVRSVRTGPALPLPSNASTEQQRAAWLGRELERRGMTLTGLRTAGGPDRKTTKKILGAVPVGENVLKRLVVGLSTVNPPVRRTDIP